MKEITAAERQQYSQVIVTVKPAEEIKEYRIDEHINGVWMPDEFIDSIAEKKIICGTRQNNAVEIQDKISINKNWYSWYIPLECVAKYESMYAIDEAFLDEVLNEVIL